MVMWEDGWSLLFFGVDVGCILVTVVAVIAGAT
jgi:hypothetical protein